MQKLTFTLLLLCSVFSFAKPPKDVQIWTIDAQKAKCEGITTSMCILVKKQTDKDFNLFYDKIEGFNYEEGFVYTIWVKETLKTPPIPADASIYNYTLVKVASKKAIKGYNNTATINNSKPLSGMNVSLTKTLIVNEEKAQCEGNPDAKCLLIKEEGKKEFEVFYQDIEGFTFNEGYRQTLLVSERHVANPMVKQAEPIYTLIKVLKSEFIFDAKKLSTMIPQQGKTVLDKKWILRIMKDSDTSSYDIEDDAVWIQFNSTDNKLNGNAPCNNFFGAFTSDYVSSIQAMAVGSTRMYCDNMKFEDMFFTLLQNADRFAIEKNKLVLYKGKRLLLVFE